MTNTRFHTLHSGEIEVQAKRDSPSNLSELIPNYIETNMPAQHAGFYDSLSYFPLATLDKEGRPWPSIIITKSNIDSSIGINVSGQNKLTIKTKISDDDPFHRAVRETKIAIPRVNTLFAGVGLDFTNRRRNKLAGFIEHAEKQDRGHLNLTLKSNEHLGNCPKYITRRTLVPELRNPETVFDHFDFLSTHLPQYCKDHINNISTLFLATKHSSKNNDDGKNQADMGLNHRGGAPGFIRMYDEVSKKISSDSSRGKADECVTTYLVLPDFSGNRFYQSLGNIQGDKLVGLVLPDFNTGNTLYITGEAENLFDDDAQQLMPRMSLVTRIRLTGAVFIKQALNLKLISNELLSPYNPPVRYLRHELEKFGHIRQTKANSIVIKATLTLAKKITASTSTFSFKLSKSITAPLPGGFCVINFSGLLNTGYSHMNENNPQLINEDYLRTWTISSAPNYNFEKKKFDPIDCLDVTVKMKSDGLISSFLHKKGKRISQSSDKKTDIILSGVGGSFSCFNKGSDGTLQIPSHMLWIAGGIGITPFMSMWDGILKLLNGNTEFSIHIILLFSGRESDYDLVRHFINESQITKPLISITIFAFLTKSPQQHNTQTTFDTSKNDLNKGQVNICKRRLIAKDIKNIEDLSNRDVFLCGPQGLIQSAKEWLIQQKVNPKKIYEESFFF